jgi:hypothetical protein
MTKSKNEAVSAICRTLLLYKHKDYELHTLAMACGVLPETRGNLIRVGLMRKHKPVFVTAVKRKVKSWKRKIDL